MHKRLEGFIMQTVIMYRVLQTQKNRDWYKPLVGRLLNEAQFSEVLCPFWIDIQKIECQVRDVTSD
jgi:hypothetical protein